MNTYILEQPLTKMRLKKKLQNLVIGIEIEAE